MFIVWVTFVEFQVQALKISQSFELQLARVWNSTIITTLKVR